MASQLLTVVVGLNSEEVVRQTGLELEVAIELVDCEMVVED